MDTALKHNIRYFNKQIIKSMIHDRYLSRKGHVITDARTQRKLCLLNTIKAVMKDKRKPKLTKTVWSKSWNKLWK